MSTKLYLTKMIDVTTPFPGRVAAINQKSGVTSTVLSQDGFDWGLAIAEAIDHASLRDDPDLVLLPDVPFDAELDTIATAVRGRFVSDMATRLNGLSFPEFSEFSQHKSKAFREFVRRIGRIHEPAFDENNFEPVE